MDDALQQQDAMDGQDPVGAQQDSVEEEPDMNAEEMTVGNKKKRKKKKKP